MEIEINNLDSFMIGLECIRATNLEDDSPVFVLRIGLLFVTINFYI